MNDTDLLEKIGKALDYDQETGIFTWKISHRNKVSVGDKAGYLDFRGYLIIGFDGELYRAHRLAWFMTHGKWPTNLIDHIDGNPSNNRISNLRDVSSAVNQQNQKNSHKGNTCGYIGSSYHRQTGKYQSRIKNNGKHIYLGLFSSPEEAHEAYLQAKRKLHEGCVI